MASAAEQLASNISLANFAKATELKQAAVVHARRADPVPLLSFVPIPGHRPARDGDAVPDQQGGVLDFFNTFSGGALERMSIIALGVMPYITASIVVQLGASLYEPWKRSRRKARPGARSSTSTPAT